MIKLFLFFATCMGFLSCTVVYYEEVKTAVATRHVDKSARFKFDSRPRGAAVYVNNSPVGETPVSFDSSYRCKAVDYRVDLVTRVRRWGADLGLGIGLAATGSLVALATWETFGPSDEKTGKTIGSIIGGGLVVAGASLIINGAVLRSRSGKIKASKKETVEQCPSPFWQVVFSKPGFIPVEKRLTVDDSLNPVFVLLSPALPPPRGGLSAEEKASLLSSMAEKRADGGENLSLPVAEAKKIVEDRIKNLERLVTIGKGYNRAGDDIFYSLDKRDDIKMFEMTTEAGYCYIVTCVAQPSTPVYMAVFQGKQEVAKDFTGSDIARVEFCSESNEPVRVTTSSKVPTPVGLRVYYKPFTKETGKGKGMEKRK